MKWTFFFAPGYTEADPDRTDVLGGKGASLATMCRAGLPVPPGFIIGIPACESYFGLGRVWPEGLLDEVRIQMARLEAHTQKRFGQGESPLLVSVRSGGAVSMPGMMDTLLNCGLHPGLETQLGGAEKFWKLYLGFVRQLVRSVAHGAQPFSLTEGMAEPSSLAVMKSEVAAWADLFEKHTGRPFPETPWDFLRESITAVFESWNTERARVYRQTHGLEHLKGTAVTIQAMFSSRLAGVVFTADPAYPDDGRIIIESARGLGEVVVSGAVTPDRYVVLRDGSDLRLANVQRGGTTPERPGENPGDRESSPSASSLQEHDVLALARLALRVEELWGSPVDVEWGWAEGAFVLLQARPIRGLDITRETRIAWNEETHRLREIARREGRRKIWVLHNLAETLPHPTPLTWDAMRRYMSGDGGFGRLYRDLGYRSGKRVRAEGFLELIGGRIYCDVDRLVELFGDRWPYRYDVAAIRRDPSLLESAPTHFDPNCFNEAFLLRLPLWLLDLIRIHRRTRRARREVLERLQSQVLPPFLARIQDWRDRDLTRHTTPQLLALLEEIEQRVLVDDAAEFLKPGFFAGCARAELQTLLGLILTREEALRWCTTLTSGLDGDATLERNFMLYRLAHGEISREDFLAQHGHRAVGEMELSVPRWREDSVALDRLLELARRAPDAQAPWALHQSLRRAREAAMRDLPSLLASHGAGSLYDRVRDLAIEAQSLLPWRETGKHYWLMGYECLRRVLVELGQRWGVGRSVFFAAREELCRFEREPDRIREQMAARKRRWQAIRRMHWPALIDSDHLDRIGADGETTVSKVYANLVILSPGIAEGHAQVVHAPEEVDIAQPDTVLVCPSTDPAWTAVFPFIRGLIVERGGVLSHGALTAREFDLPAVVCPEATQRFRTGMRLKLDAVRGVICIEDDRGHSGRDQAVPVAFIPTAPDPSGD